MSNHSGKHHQDGKGSRQDHFKKAKPAPAATEAKQEAPATDRGRQANIQQNTTNRGYQQDR